MSAAWVCVCVCVSVTCVCVILCVYMCVYVCACVCICLRMHCYNIVILSEQTELCSDMGQN